MKKSNDNVSIINDNNNNNNNNSSGDEECKDPLKAIKLVPKSVFWSRVTAGQERADTLVREVLAQFIVCQPIKHSVTLPSSLPPSLPLSQSRNGILNGDRNTTSPLPLKRSTSTSTATSIAMPITPSFSPPLPPFPFNPPSVPIVQIFGAYETVDCFALELELMQPTGITHTNTLALVLPLLP